MVAGWQRVCESPNAPEAAGTMPLAHLEQAPPSLDYAHVPLAGFEPGQPVTIGLRIQPTVEGLPISVRLHYRHVNQAEPYRVAGMAGGDEAYSATIPGDYTDSAYPLQYFFELRRGSTQAWLYPGLSKDLANQPYLVIRRHAIR